MMVDCSKYSFLTPSIDMPLKIVKVVIYGISGELNLSTQPPNYQPEYSDIETLTFVDDAKFVETYVNWEPDIVVVIGNVTHFPNICEQQSSLKSKLYILSKEELNYRGINYFVEEFFKLKIRADKSITKKLIFS